MPAFRPHDLPLVDALAQAELGVWLWFPETDQCAVAGNLGALGNTAPPEQLEGWLALLHPQDRQQISLFLKGHGDNPDDCFDGDIRILSAKGRWRSFATSGRWRPAQKALPRHALFTLRDVTKQRANEEHLRKSEKAYRTLVETSPDAILLLQLDGTLQMANQQAQHLFGLDELRDSSETSLRDFLVAGEDPASAELLRALAYPDEFTGIVVNRNLRLRNGNGQPFEAEIAFTTVFDDNGQPGGLVLFARDVTEKVRAATELQKHQTQLEALVQERTHALEAAHAALAQILEGSPVPTFVLDVDNVVTHWNQACEKIIGTPAREMVGTRNQWRAFYPEPRPVLADLVMSGSLRTIEEYYGDKFRPSYLIDGAFEAESYFPKSRRWMVFTAAPLKDSQGNIIGAIETMQDITERKLAEQYLLEAKQLAESAARTKAEFLANMSHEIRTPMNAVIGLAHVLLKTDLSSKQREQVMRIRGAGKMLLGLINDILDFSKIEAGRMTLEVTDFNLDELLDGVATVVLNQAQTKGLELNYVVAPTVPHQLRGDPLRLSQVLVNLIGNAIKFTEQGSITVSIDSAPLDSDQLQLAVSICDTGIGMTEEQQQRLFQAFTQADNSITRKFGGTGLGLTISKRLVELMGGEISVASEVGAGSTFRFTAQIGIGAGEAIPPPATVRRALVVDDNALARVVLARLFERIGCTVATAESAEEALEVLARDAAFDCIAIDHDTPGLETPGILNSIRSRAGADSYLVLVTAQDIHGLGDEALLADFDDTLSKPVTAAQIRRVVAHLATPDVALASGQSTSRLAGMRVLLAEDLPTNQLIAREMLESFGIVVEIAENGSEALQLLAQGDYDLILMDLQMPDMDGIEATRRIRADQRWQDIPIVAMTAHAFDEEQQRCMAAGMNDFLTKPIDPEVLEAALARWRSASTTKAPLVAPAAAPEAVRDWPQLPGIDTAEGLRRMMNKPQLYVKVLRDFHQRFRNETTLIQTALSTGDLEAACRSAHSVKGLAGSIGARELQAAALALETAVRAQDPALAAHQAEFAARLREVIDSIASAYSVD